MSHNFTKDFNTRVNRILTDAVVAKVGAGAGPKLLALWDTGASGCAIDDSKAKSLGLPVVSRVLMNHAGGQSWSDVYLADIAIPNSSEPNTYVGITNVKLTGCKLLSGFDMIIGMDVINRGDFCITNKDGKTVVSFRIPSQTKIDFAKDAQDQKIRDLKKIGRNAKCPCGSGKKVKNCCGLGLV